MPGAIFLEGERINLRTIEEEDVEFIRDEFNNPAVWSGLSHSKPGNLEQKREFFEDVICDDEQIDLAICKEGEIMGTVDLIPEEEGVYEIGIWLAEKFQSKGYGTEASEMIINYAFNELRCHKVTARAYSSNVGSQRVWEKLGFKQEGVQRKQIFREGKFEDAVLYGVLEEEWEE